LLPSIWKEEENWRKPAFLRGEEKKEGGKERMGRESVEREKEEKNAIFSMRKKRRRREGKGKNP